MLVLEPVLLAVAMLATDGRRSSMSYSGVSWFPVDGAERKLKGWFPGDSCEATDWVSLESW